MSARRIAVVAGLVISAIALPAHAANVTGTHKSESLSGTGRGDVIVAKAGNDKIYPKGGRDVVWAGPGDDYIFLRNDGKVDRIHCGRGFDVVAWSFTVDQHDIIAADCEAKIA